MIAPLSPDIVPVDHNTTQQNLERLIEAINARILDALKRTGIYDNKDGTFDRYRCVIYFKGDTDEPEYLYHDWDYYHTFLMDAYRKVGWHIKTWLPGLTRNIQGYEHPVPCYCLYVPETPIPELLDHLQDTLQKPC